VATLRAQPSATTSDDRGLEAELVSG
jgi:hypothetical protein